MKSTVFTFLIFLLIAFNIFAQSTDPIVVEVQHRGYDRLGQEFFENMKELIDEAPQYKLWLTEERRFQIFISTLDPLKSEKMEPVDKICSAGYAFVLRTVDGKNVSVEMYISSGIISFQEGKTKKAAQKILYDFNEIIAKKNADEIN